MSLMEKIASAFNVATTNDTFKVYWELFGSANPQDFTEAVDRTLREWREPSKLPPPYFIAERLEAAIRERIETDRPRRQIPDEFAPIDTEKLPKGWTDAEVLEARRVMRLARESSSDRQPITGDPNESRENFARRIVAEMRHRIKAGAHAMPTARPEDYKDYMASRERAELLMKSRNVISAIPEDPGERRSWARDKAVKGGWIEAREPGEEA